MALDLSELEREIESVENEIVKHKLLVAPFIYACREARHALIEEGVGADHEKLEKFFRDWLRAVGLIDAEVIDTFVDGDGCRIYIALAPSKGVSIIVDTLNYEIHIIPGEVVEIPLRR